MSKTVLFSTSLEKEFALLNPELKKLFKKDSYKTKLALYDKNLINPNTVLFYVTSSSKDKIIPTKLSPFIIVFDSKITATVKNKKLFLNKPAKNNATTIALTLYLYISSCYYENAYISASKSIEAFEQFSDFSRKELLETKKILDANEKVQELSRTELIEKAKVLKAEESTLELSRKEQIEKDQQIKARMSMEKMAQQEIAIRDTLLKAWDIFYDIIRKELIEMKQQFDAESETLNLSTTELINKDKAIKAFEQLNEWERKELIDAQKTIGAEESVLNFNRKKMLHWFQNIDNLTSDNIKTYLSIEEWNSLPQSMQEKFISFFKILFKSMFKTQ